jgi:hypothetical protein
MGQVEQKRKRSNKKEGDTAIKENACVSELSQEM